MDYNEQQAQSYLNSYDNREDEIIEPKYCSECEEAELKTTAEFDDNCCAGCQIKLDLIELEKL